MVDSSVSHEISLIAGSGAVFVDVLDECGTPAGARVGVDRSAAPDAKVGRGGVRPDWPEDQMSTTAAPNTTSTATSRAATIGNPDRLGAGAVGPAWSRFERRMPGAT